MNTIQEERAKAIKYHIDAIKFNAKKSGNFKVICNMNNQLEKYESRIAKLSLPHRFGMYKSLKNNAKVDDSVELETPKTQIDSTYSSLTNPNHKIRSIF